MLSDKSKACYLCQQSSDLRPYGEAGRWLCFSCMESDPAIEAEARCQFAAQIAGIAGPVVIGEEVGPYPVEHNPQLEAAIRALGRQHER